MSRYNNRYQRSHSRDQYDDDYYHNRSYRNREDDDYNYGDNRNYRERDREKDRDYYHRSREKERDKEKQERERLKEIEYERMVERERMKEREMRLEKERQSNKPVSKWSESTSKFTSKPAINPINPIENKMPFIPFPNPQSQFIANMQTQLNLNNNIQPQSPNHNSIFQSQPQQQEGNIQNPPNTTPYFPAMYPTPIPINLLTPGANMINNDSMKIKKKIYIPKKTGINYVGLLIGPKGTYQKRLQQQSGCKILVRGKGTQKEGMPPQPDDNEEKHVLIIGDTEENISRAVHLVEKILFADEATRTKIKEEQIKASQEIRTELLLNDTSLPLSSGPPLEEHLMTPYGPPDKSARYLQVPDDCVGLIIGKNGDTIRRLNRESACKIQIAVKPIPDSKMRYVFIEGPEDRYEVAKKLIEAIIAEQVNMKMTSAHLGESNPHPGPYTLLKIPNKMVGLIIGRNGETVKLIQESTGCDVFIPKESRPGEDFRELQLSGKPENIEICRREIISMIHLALYGRLPYMNSLFYPYIDPNTHLPIIDPGIMAQLDPNSHLKIDDDDYNFQKDDKKEKNKFKNKIMNKDKSLENKEGQENNPDINTDIKETEIKESEDENINIKNNISYENFEKYIFDNSKNDNKELKYDLENYNNPINYDLYYQSMYQMYPQMNDYYKKAKTQDEVLGGESQPLVLLNSSLLDPTQVNMMIESKIYSSLQQKDDDRGNINNNRNAKMNKNRLF